jgi:hypothetical protein
MNTMTTEYRDNFLELVRTALDVMNHAFVDVEHPRTMAMEFFHQFRKLWDRGIPVGMKLGHLTTLAVPGVDVAIQRLGEHGQPTENLAAILFTPAKPIQSIPGFPLTIVVASEDLPSVQGVITIVFDVKRWKVA